MILTYCRCSSSVEHQLPKLRRRVRFPLSAPRAKNLSVTSFLPLETAEAPTFLQSPNEASVRKQPPTSGTIVGFLQNHTFLPFPLPNFPFSTFNFQFSILIFPSLAQLDRVSDSDSEGRGFESRKTGQKRALRKQRSFLTK